VALSKKSTKLLESLIATFSAESQPGSGNVERDFRGSDVLSLRIPQTREERMQSLADNKGWPALLIKGDDVHLFLTTLSSLRVEPELEHLTDEEVERELTRFVTEVWKTRTTFTETGVLRVHIDQFVQRVAKPFVEYEVMFGIQGLVVGDDPLCIARCRFRRFTATDIEDWGLNCTDDGGWSAQVIEELSKCTLGVVQVRANNDAIALDRTQKAVDSALHALRLCFSQFGFRIPDDQLLMRRQGLYVARVRGESGWTRSGFERLLSPMDLELDDLLRDSTLNVADSIAAIYTEILPEKIRLRFVRAVEWIGSSVTREHYDDKIVDLCTALECFLVPSTEGKKGERIALRCMLLGMVSEGWFHDPRDVLRLYEQRSMVVHGSERDISSEAECNLLRRWAKDALCQAISIALNEKARLPHDLYTFLETRDRLVTATRWFEKRSDEYAQKLLEYTRGLIYRGEHPFIG
jgi:hypothetical protein